MAMQERDVEVLLDIVLLYVPRPAAQQMFGEMERSRAAEQDPALAAWARRLRELCGRRATPQQTSPTKKGIRR